MRYLIIGGGISGTSAAEEIRKLDAGSTITILSEEQYPIYSRVLLPHYIKGKIPRERCFLKKPEWYAAQKIDWLPGVSALQLDVVNKFVSVSDGREYEYDKLLIASGGEVKMLPEDQRGISYLRTIDDADHLLQLLNEGPKEATIIGGGFIGLEYVNIFADRHIPAEMHLRDERILPSVLDVDSSELIRLKAEADGVTFRPKSFPEHLQGLVGVGVGIAPELGWLKDGGIETDRGVITDEFLQTNIADIYAAGDITEFYDTVVERRVKIGNWMNAMQQGRAAGKTMAGVKTAFDLVSSYATSCRGMEIIFIGDVDRRAAEQVVVKGSVAEGGVAQHFVRGGKLVGATLVNRNSDRAGLTKQIKDKTFYV
ncbi:MAG: FAD-dependent oxidoreductase [Patescibacteria group bacterium]